jgi:hypothetical protein
MQMQRSKQTAQRLINILHPSADPLRCSSLAQQARTAGAKDDASVNANSWWLMGGDAGRASAAAEIRSIKEQRAAARKEAEVRGCSPKGIRHASFLAPLSFVQLCQLSGVYAVGLGKVQYDL